MLGPKIMKNDLSDHIPFNNPFVVGKELYYIAQAVMQEKHLAGDGAFTKKCQLWLENRLGCAKALLTHSCTAALEMAAILCDIGPGDEVIMPSFTFVSTANAFVLRGGVPVFIDIRPDTLNMDERLIEAAITPRTRAIVPVHYAGMACDMDTIMAIAEKHGLVVVEDAAQALLSTHRNKYLGTVGHLGCLSFHETKNIISGEGGALLINDPRLIERAEIIREKGTDRSRFFRGEIDKYTWQDVGSSFLPSELTAAFLYAQLEEAERIISKRCRIHRRYQEMLQSLADGGDICLPGASCDCAQNGHIFYILTGSQAMRNGLLHHLRKAGIHAVFHYVPLHSSPAGNRFGRTVGEMVVTDMVSEQLLRLPLFYEMREDEVDRVVTEISGFIQSFKKVERSSS
jgi:dTDP-4-amino-4,6-dideoxygalactose transaminase